MIVHASSISDENSFLHMTQNVGRNPKQEFNLTGLKPILSDSSTSCTDVRLDIAQIQCSYDQYA